MSYTNTVQKSLMPKGVEHPLARHTPPELARVQKSLMPKGVEHFVNSNFTGRTRTVALCRNL